MSELPLTAAQIDTIRGAYPDWQQSRTGAQPAALFVYNLNPASISGGVTIDVATLESYIGPTTDPAVSPGSDGSLNSLLKRVSIDLAAIQALYGNDPNQAASATGDLMQRLRAIAENTATTSTTPLAPIAGTALQLQLPRPGDAAAVTAAANTGINL